MALKWADGNGGCKDVLSLPTASDSVKGGVKVGQNLYMAGESLNASPMGGISFGGGLHFDDNNGALTFDPLEGIPVGGGLYFDNGTLMFDPIEGIPVGDGLYFDNGTLNAVPAAYWCPSTADLPANPQQGCLAIIAGTPYFYGGGSFYGGESWAPFCQFEVFAGATSYADGEKGLVPKPVAGEQNKVLHGNGTWSPFLLDTVPSTLEGAMWLSVH